MRQRQPFRFYQLANWWPRMSHSWDDAHLVLCSSTHSQVMTHVKVCKSDSAWHAGGCGASGIWACGRSTQACERNSTRCMHNQREVVWMNTFMCMLGALLYCWLLSKTESLTVRAYYYRHMHHVGAGSSLNRWWSHRGWCCVSTALGEIRTRPHVLPFCDPSSWAYKWTQTCCLLCCSFLRCLGHEQHIFTERECVHKKTGDIINKAMWCWGSYKPI